MTDKDYATYRGRIQNLSTPEEAEALAEELVANPDPEARDLGEMLAMVRSARWPEGGAGG